LADLILFEKEGKVVFYEKKLVIISFFIVALFMFGLNVSAVDNVPQLQITDIKVENIGYRSAEISWKTTDDAESRIKVWESTSFNVVYRGETGKGKEHRIKIDGLSPNKEYTYQIYTEKPEMELGVKSDVYSFKTAELYEITDIKVENIGYRSAEISWKTTDEAESIIEVWESTSFNVVYRGETGKGKEHRIKIDGLSPNKEYIYQIYTEKPEMELGVKSDVYSFKTLEEQTGYKVSGYVAPEFIADTLNPSSLKSGFKVEIQGTELNAITDENGYFEIINVSSQTQYDLKISKSSYLTREIKNVEVKNDVEISKLEEPIYMWAGDIAIDGVQDNVINIIDIIEMAKVFNSVSGEGKYE